MDEIVNSGTPIAGESLPDVDVVDNSTDNGNTDQHVDVYEDQAREQGWRPKDEWEGDPEKWRPAKEFVERGELFGKIDHMGRELKETKKALKMLQEHHTKVRESEYKKAVDELKALQRQHLESGNSDGYLETTELLQDLKTEQKAREVVQEITPAAPDPRFTDWVRANPWYTKDDKMREYADSVGLGYAQRNKGVDPEDVLKYVAAEVKERFKERFQNPNRTKPSSVEGGRNATAQAKNETKFVMTDEERRVMNTFIRTGAMDKEQYIAEIKRMRGAA